jgi:glutamate carboxypeptidase
VTGPGSVAVADLAARLQARLPEMLEMLEAIVTTHSHTANPDGVERAARIVVEPLAKLGFTFDTIPPPALAEEDGWLQDLFSPGVAYPGLGSTYLGVREGELGGHLVLLGDLDTAFPGEPGHSPPFRIEGNRAYGPGIADMKAGLVVMVAALQALRELDVDLPRVSVVLSGDEQAGSLGSRRVIENIGSGADWFLCTECARQGGKLMASRGHIGVGTLTVTGVEAHTGADRDSGVDALEALAKLVIELKALSRPDEGTLITVTLAAAGRRRSVVPALATATVDIRTADAAAWNRATATMQQVAGAVADETGADVLLRTFNHRPGMPWTARTDELLAIASAVGAELGIKVEAFASAAAGSTAFADDGAYALDGLGPLGAGIMTEHEHIEIDSLAPRAALLAGLIDRLPR